MAYQTLLAATMAVSVVVVLWGEALGKRLAVVIAKPVASSCFLLVGVFRLAGGSGFDAWIVTGLSLCLIGDVLLLSQRAFPAGLATFLCGHLAYVAACTTRLAIGAWPRLPLLPLAIAAGVVLAWLWPRLGVMRVPVAAYVVIISAMVWGAVALASGGAGPFRFAIGAVLFYLSDLAVARNRFVSPGLVNRMWGLPLYYLGQFLIATTV
jgi:uncharacterized membrane protein YhhN